MNINWQSDDSYYALSTGDTIQVAYAVVMAAYIMAVILLTELILIVSLLLYWITNQMALVWIGILVFYVVDVYRVNKVFQLLMISYKNWRDEKSALYGSRSGVMYSFLYNRKICGKEKRLFTKEVQIDEYENNPIRYPGSMERKQSKVYGVCRLYNNCMYML